MKRRRINPYLDRTPTDRGAALVVALAVAGVLFLAGVLLHACHGPGPAVRVGGRR